MELSIPYFALRDLSSLTQSDNHAEKDTNRWTDLPFFESLGSSIGSNRSRWTIQEAHTSVVICGWSHAQWTGYAFSKGMSVDEETYGDETYDEETYEDTSEISEEYFDEDMPAEDLFASGGSQHRFMECTSKVMDPRIYFLHVLEIRVEMICQEWTYLVRSLEDGAVKWVSGLKTSHSDLY
jgi:hypothetical protein